MGPKGPEEGAERGGEDGTEQKMRHTPISEFERNEIKDPWLLILIHK